MIEPSLYTLVAFKEKLQAHGLAASRSKNELIARLMKTNPEGEWLREYYEDEQGIYIDEQHGSATSSNIYQRETDKREKKLASCRPGTTKVGISSR